MTHGQLAWCSLFHAATENNLNLDCLSKWQARGLPRRARSLAGQGAHAYYTYTHIYMHACITTVILNVLINPKPPGYPRRCHARCRRRGARATQEAHQPAGHNLQTPDVTARRASDRRPCERYLSQTASPRRRRRPGAHSHAAGGPEPAFFIYFPRIHVSQCLVLCILLGNFRSWRPVFLQR